jgi:cysteinyl-tRNA synthetase
MSKSKGNYYTLGDLVAKGNSPMAVRYALLARHPRKQMNFTLDSLHAAESALKALVKFSQGLGASAAANPGGASTVFEAAFRALGDDLNTPGALGALFTAANALGLRAATAADKASFDRLLYALGLDLTKVAEAATAQAVPAEIDLLAKRRWEAKKAKDFAAADRLRGELGAAGWSMLDGKDGYKLEPLKKG